MYDNKNQGYDKSLMQFLKSFVSVSSYRKEVSKITKARMHAVTPVPHEVTTGFSTEMPAAKLHC